jgi:hypothetical protein
MTMAAATLATELLSLTPTSVEDTAIDAIVDAYGVFASDAVSNAILISPAGIELGKAAMSAALVGMSEENEGRTKIPAAVVAFWTAVSGGLTASFTGALAITPPPHATLSDDFATLMDENMNGDVSAEEAAEALANLLYEQAALGGTVTYPVVGVAVIT